MGAIPSTCVLALADMTADGSNAAWRGAGLARDLGLPLHVLLADVREDDLALAQELARELAGQAQLRLGVPATGHAATGPTRRLVGALTPPPALLVLPYKRGNALADCVFGAAAERIFRSVFVPTLVVKQPASSAYRRVLVASRLEESATLLIGAARRLSRGPRISVVHVIGTNEEQALRTADVPEHALRAQRLRRSTAAWHELNRLVAAAGAAQSATAHILSGFAPASVQETVHASRAQLAIVGKRRGPPLGQLLADGVSQRLVRQGCADVLMLPLHRDGRRARSMQFV